MNQGIYDGINHGSSTLSPDDQLYVGFWGDIRPIIGNEEPGVQLKLDGNNPNLAVPPIMAAVSPPPPLLESPWTVAAIETPFDSQAFEISVPGVFRSNSTYNHWIIDVAVGPLGKERVILDSFLLGSRFTSLTNAGQGDHIGPFPIYIPAGSRVCYRFRLNTSGNVIFSTAAAMLHFHRYYPKSGNMGQLVSNFVHGSTSVVPIPTPAAVDTEGAFDSIGFLPFDTTWILPCGIIANNVITYSTSFWAIDYAYVDNSGSVIEIISNVPGLGNSNECQWTLNRPYPISLPAGTELQARGRFGGTTGNATGFIPAVIAIGATNVDTGRRPIGPIGVAI